MIVRLRSFEGLDFGGFTTKEPYNNSKSQIAQEIELDLVYFTIEKKNVEPRRKAIVIIFNRTKDMPSKGLTTIALNKSKNMTFNDFKKIKYIKEQQNQRPQTKEV